MTPRTAMVPETSTTLLRDVSDPQHARWAEFYARYEPMMRAFLGTHFPSLDADDIVQETFAALARVLPAYVYDPQETGHFHNYLTGVLRNKALKALAARRREAHREGCAAEEAGDAVDPQREAEERQWRECVYELALRQLLADETIQARTKQAFVRLAVNGEPPESVAKAFGVPYNTVVKMKERALVRLRRYAEALKGV